MAPTVRRSTETNTVNAVLSNMTVRARASASSEDPPSGRARDPGDEGYGRGEDQRTRRASPRTASPESAHAAPAQVSLTGSRTSA
jgi:hypothetical protein